MKLTFPTRSRQRTSLPFLSHKQSVRALIAAGSVMFTGLVAGAVVKYRDRLRRAVRKYPSDGTPLEEWTKADLYEKAREAEIEGRSTMSKAELAKALRAE